MLERDFLYESKILDDPWDSSGSSNERNREILMVLFRAGIQVYIEKRSALLHSNFILTKGVVLLTSANLTETGLEENYDGLLVIDSPPVYEAFEREFDRLMLDMDDSSPSIPLELKLNQVDTKLVFGPRHAPEMEIMKQLIKAKHRIDIAVFTFSTSSGIDDSLLACRQRGIPIRLVVDSDQVNQNWSPVPKLKEQGVEIRHIGGHGLRLHHKLIVVDDKVLVWGTFNFTKAARFSHESIIVFGKNSHEIEQEPNEKMLELTTFYRNEIQRIFDMGVRV